MENISICHKTFDIYLNNCYLYLLTQHVLNEHFHGNKPEDQNMD
jgi:hypothetical protein